MTRRTPRELIELYVEEIWNKGNAELIREVCADPMVRHEAGKVLELNHDQQVERVRKTVAATQPRFTNLFVVADEDHVATIWKMTRTSEKFPTMSGVEVFRVRDGRLAECWNHPHVFGHWG
jgi:hypothetical protein